jgi:hypothetical protein
MNFIYQAYLDDPSICDKMIAQHGVSSSKHPGTTNRDGVNVVDKRIKDSEDSYLDAAVSQEYFAQLAKILRAYADTFPMSRAYAEWVLDQVPIIQHYQPNGGYFPWHCERNQGSHAKIAARHLVYITYLNDVTDGGETEFYHQKLKIQPRKGLTIVWPVDWTYTHRGVPSPTQEKYIATGWIRFA